ncbi:MAG: 2-keto-4-pentenoate hydratase [Hyphomicrobiales bacterium]|nr:MAG: 2-keto-4-pentenoate hydratase [Hyphomicrobiales bacterium]
MKLASLLHGRDGRLVVVSRDLTRATDAFPVVPTLQAALDDWDRLAPRLADLAVSLEHGSVPSFRFHEHDCAAPLPRTYRRLMAAGSDAALMTMRSDAALGPREAVRARDENAGILVEAGFAVVTGDVPADVGQSQASAHIRLVMLACSVKVQNQVSSDGRDIADPADLEQSFSFSPVVVTPDEIGPAWRNGGIDLPLLRQINQQSPHRGNTGGAGDAAKLIAKAAQRHALGAGTILATIVPLAQDQPLRFGDTVRIEMKDAAGHTIFGAIEQEILPAG